MKVIWRASLHKNCEQANQCNNSGETEEVNVLPSREKIKCNWILVKTVEEITRYELQPYPVMFGGGENMWFLLITVKESQKKRHGCDSFIACLISFIPI